MECRVCSSKRWLSARVFPEDIGSSNYEDLACPVCNLDGAASPFNSEDWLYWVISPVGGDNGPYSLFENFVDGQLAQSILVSRKVYDFWQPTYFPVMDCPVCHGWGVWSNNGQIADCLACGGQPIEARQAYDPICAFWQPWWLKSNIFVPRGTTQL